MPRRQLLDLFCGSGGVAMGYYRAGFDVVGVDNEAHADYPFPLVLADALDVLRSPTILRDFDVIHASPPCTRYTKGLRHHPERQVEHPDLIAPVRQLLRAWGGPWVIENVPGAPLRYPILICGRAMGLPTIARHRLFESSVFLMSPGCGCGNERAMSVFGHAATIKHPDGRRQHIPTDEVKRLMGVEWIRRRDDVKDAIPPAYTEFLGWQLLDHLDRLDQRTETPA